MNKKNNIYKNLLVDSDFKFSRKSWLTKNCTILQSGKNLIVKSDGRLFGLNQDFLFLKKSSRLYFRAYIKTKFPLDSVFVGINVNGHLHTGESQTLINNRTMISVIVDVKQEDVFNSELGVYIIFITKSRTNRIEIEKPFLIDLDEYGLHYETLKNLELIPYSSSFSYENCLTGYPFGKSVFDRKIWSALKNNGTNIRQLKSGELLITTLNFSRLRQKISLKIGHKYLIKILSKSLNSIGYCSNIINSNTLILNMTNILAQNYMIIEAKEKQNTFELSFVNSNNIIPMSYFIKDIMMIDLTENKMEDISETDILQLKFL